MGRKIKRLFTRCALLCGIAAPLLFQYPLFTADQDEAALNAVNAVRASEFLTIKSENFTIYYRPDVDLRRVERRLRRSSFFGGGSSSSGDAAEDVTARLETLLSRVRETLGMYSGRMNISVKIFKTRNELNEAYYNIFRTEENYISFYIHKFETIYTTENDISDAVMSHELAHAVTDHYFAVIPPDKIRELIASYIEENIEE